MHILIATRNLDKYKIITHLFRIVDDKLSFASLHDLNLDLGLNEKGSISVRAKQKALNYWSRIKKNKKYNDIKMVIGIDDGFSLSEKDEGNPHSKVTTDKILSHRYIDVGQQIWLKRAYCIVGENILSQTFISSIPFVFIGNKNSISRRKDTYPLSYVLGPVNDSNGRSITDLELKKRMSYYFKYSRPQLKAISQIINSF